MQRSGPIRIIDFMATDTGHQWMRWRGLLFGHLEAVICIGFCRALLTAKHRGSVI